MINLKMLEMPKEAYVPSLFALFRQYGYDGVTLSKIAAATGLGKASLYHHFPGGKDEMVEAVLGFSDRWLQENVLVPLASEGEPQARLQKMCDRINDLYAGGTKPCLLAMLQSGTGRDIFHAKVQTMLESWIGAIAAVLTDTGMDEVIARQRGEDAMIAIQGALMLSQGLDDSAPFQRVIQSLPQLLCSPT